jgi:prepilin peptidase CpaA
MPDVPGFLLVPAATAAAAAALIVAGARDAAERRIPNRTVLVVAGAGLAWLAALPPADAARHATMGLVALALGLPLFARGLVGGGDVKLAAALLPWAGPALLAPFLLMLALATLGTAGLVVLRRAMAPGSWARMSLPMGVPLAVAGLWLVLVRAGLVPMPGALP